ncbi:RNA polymerase sigma factor (sigma-70 family) [Virgibacillus halotolerans]|uniref:sigma-70 family RNA polymerase sigma factor n=1 Tax=Virgibacillus halotolerans TaxID=1071053 RepID=UPI00195FE5C5|nr:sigma-70 family RNA polymerase sigma factor [Virgibacillus halotolerans]MBM7600477.1 RNA polymerase sigma factor (sigma-70 family) [Virgibacillus halotolerans]
MNKQQLNNLVVMYQETKSDEIFSEIFESLGGFIAKTVQNISTRYRMDKLEVESEVHFKIYDVAKDYKAELGDFENILRVSISNSCKSILRKPKVESVNLEYGDDEGNTVSIFEELEGENLSSDLEEELIEHITKKRDQRQLISDLLEKADNKSRQALTAYSDSTSYLDAAKRLGTCNKTIERRIRKIANLFDANQKGDKSDYFTVLTESIA